MENIFFIIISAMLMSYMVANTRGDGVNILIKTVVGTVLCSIFMLILMCIK